MYKANVIFFSFLGESQKAKKLCIFMLSVAIVISRSEDKMLYTF